MSIFIIVYAILINQQTSLGIMHTNNINSDHRYLRHKIMRNCLLVYKAFLSNVVRLSQDEKSQRPH